MEGKGDLPLQRVGGRPWSTYGVLPSFALGSKELLQGVEPLLEHEAYPLGRQRLAYVLVHIIVVAVALET